MTTDFDEKRFFAQSGVSRETMEKVRIYAKLLKKWQKQINLVSAATVDDMWQRHFYDSFQLDALIEGARIKFTLS